jgi:site-specific recombinase XerC
LYLNKAVVTAADAYFIIAQTKDQGLYYEQFASRMALSLNTARQYANWLVEKKLISIAEDPENRRKVILRVVHEKK